MSKSANATARRFRPRAWFIAAAVLLLGALCPGAGPGPGSVQAANLSSPTSITCITIPASAEFVFPGGFDVFTMDRDGGNVTQITFSLPLPSPFEHVSVSRDRRYLAGATNWSQGGTVPPKLFIVDLVEATLKQVVPDFVTAGIGGADWDASGRIYFGAIPNRRSSLTDIYRMKFDGSNLKRLASTSSTNEGDLAVSKDSMMLAYTREFLPGTPDEYTEIWTSKTDGSGAKMVYRGGTINVGAAQNPEFSPDGQKLVFDVVNPDYVNFPAGPKTAHDIYTINIDGTGLTRLTLPGPISIVPSWSWSTGLIVFTQLYDGNLNLLEYGSETYMGAATINSTDVDQIATRILAGPWAARQIP